MAENTNQISYELSVMTNVANNKIDKLEVGGASYAANQMRMFLVAQAKNELHRILKMTEFLDRVESRFIETSELLMSEYPDNLDIVQNTLDTIIKCMNRSNELVVQILKDEKLNSFTFDVADVKEQEENKFKSLSVESRKDIRNMAANMLSQLEKISNEEKHDDENS